MLLGDFTAAAAEAERYVEDHPADVRGWELVVAAYLRGNQPAEARRVCFAAGEVLAATDGLPPPLRELCDEATERDGTGQHRGYEVASSGGSVTLLDRGPGKAVKFPPPCGGRTTADCPGAVIDVADAQFLNPGTRPFSYSADLLVGPDDYAPGANVIQKGTGVSPTNQSPNQ